MVWNVAPQILSLGGFELRYYGLLFATGFFVGAQLILRSFRLEGKNVDHANQLIVYMIVATILGARLGHFIFYEPQVFWTAPLKVLRVWEGGLASHGATIGILLALTLFIRKHKDLSWLWIADRLTMPIAFTGSLVRLGNFFNSEILGRPSDVPWAVVFQRVSAIPRHPSQLYESLSYMMIFGLLIFIYERKRPEIPKGRLAGLFLMLHFSARFLIEFTKENQEAFEAKLPINMGQILSIPLVLFGAFLFIRTFRKANE